MRIVRMSLCALWAVCSCNSKSVQTAQSTSGTEPDAATGTPAFELGIMVEPLDGMSNVGVVVPSVLVFSSGEVVPEPVLKDLVPFVRLETWPEAVVVPSTITTAGGTKDDHRGRIELTPKSALSDRWYAIVIAPGAKGLTPPGVGPTKIQPDGSAIARFRPGSDPRLVSMEICTKDKGVISGRLTFSEPVTAPASGVPIVLTYADGGAPSCSFALPPPPAGTSKSALNPVDVYYFSCASLEMDKALQVQFGTGMNGPSSGVTAFTEAVRVNTLPTSQPACVQWKRDF